MWTWNVFVNDLLVDSFEHNFQRQSLCILAKCVSMCTLLFVSLLPRYDSDNNFSELHLLVIRAHIHIVWCFLCDSKIVLLSRIHMYIYQNIRSKEATVFNIAQTLRSVLVSTFYVNFDNLRLVFDSLWENHFKLSSVE